MRKIHECARRVYLTKINYLVIVRRKVSNTIPNAANWTNGIYHSSLDIEAIRDTFSPIFYERQSIMTVATWISALIKTTNNLRIYRLAFSSSISYPILQKQYVHKRNELQNSKIRTKTMSIFCLVGLGGRRLIKARGKNSKHCWSPWTRRECRKESGLTRNASWQNCPGF